MVFDGFDVDPLSGCVGWMLLRMMDVYACLLKSFCLGLGFFDGFKGLVVKFGWFLVFRSGIFIADGLFRV